MSLPAFVSNLLPAGLLSFSFDGSLSKSEAREFSLDNLLELLILFYLLLSLALTMEEKPRFLCEPSPSSILVLLKRTLLN
jgi:hypothetical protein